LNTYIKFPKHSFIKTKIRENNKATNSRIKFILVVISFMLLLVARDIFLINIPNIVHTTFAGIAFIMFTYEECVAYAIMFTVIGSGVAVNYILGIGLLIMMVKKKSGIINVKCIPIWALLIWELLHAFVPPFFLLDYIRYVICMLVFMVIVYDDKSKIDPIFVLKSFLYSTLFVCVDIFIQTLRMANYSLGMFMNSNFRYGDMTIFENTLTDTITSANQNSVGEFCIISITILLLFLYSKTGNKLENGILIILFATFGFLTLSKAYLITLLFVVAFYLLTTYKLGSFYKLVKNLLLLLVIFGIFIFLMDQLFPNTIQALLDRFGSEDVFSQRDIIFKEYNEMLFSDPFNFLFGIGSQGKSAKTGIHSPHNSTQELFVNWGIIGFILMTCIIYNIITTAKNKINCNNIPAIYYITLFAVFLSTQAGQLFSMNERMLYFAVVFFTLNLYSRKDVV